ncbi:MAG: MFS transporter, partial [Opitutaceae bacterium]
MEKAPRRRGAFRWGVCLLLLAATVLSYLDRQTVAICAPAISKEFHLSNEQFGGLLAAFRWTYAAAQVPAGWLADLFGFRGLYAVALGLWSLAGGAAAWSRSDRALGSARAVLGVGEAFNTPCALLVTAEVLPPEDRDLGNGLFNSGAAIGALIAPLVIGPIAVRWGWRTAFAAVGSLGALWVV